MKAAHLVLVLLLLLCSLGNGQDCSDINRYYGRQIPYSSFTWSWDGNTGGAHYPAPDYDPVTVDQVRGAIQEALGAWRDAANREGTRITFTEGTSDHHMTFAFTEGPEGQCGDASTWDYVQIYRNWVFDDLDKLKTTILHEVGHAFLGGGHHGDGVLSNAIGGDCHLKCLSIGDCERN